MRRTLQALKGNTTETRDLAGAEATPSPPLQGPWSLHPSAHLLFLSPPPPPFPPLLSPSSLSPQPHCPSIPVCPSSGFILLPFKGPAKTDHCLCIIPFPGRDSDRFSLSQVSSPSLLNCDGGGVQTGAAMQSQGPGLPRAPGCLGGRGTLRRGMDGAFTKRGVHYHVDASPEGHTHPYPCFENAAAPPGLWP